MAVRIPSRALRCSNLPCQASSSVQNITIRCFSSSQPTYKNGAVPSFAIPTPSSEDLASHLNAIRQKIFLPSFLSPIHYKLVHRPKNRRMLEDDPLTVTIAGEDHRLQFIDETQDGMSAFHATKEAIELFVKKEDWDHLPQLLEGMRTAKRQAIKKLWGPIVRKAVRAGRADVIVDSVRKYKETGLTMTGDKGELIDQFAFWSFHTAAIDKRTNSAGKQRAGKALGLFNDLLINAEREKLWSLNGCSDGDWGRRPQIVGTALALAALQAERQFDGKDTLGKVALYAQRLLSVTEADPALESLYRDGNAAEQTRDANKALPVLYAWNAAARILGDKEKVFSSRAEAVRKRLQSARSVRDEEPPIEAELRVALDGSI